MPARDPSSDDPYPEARWGSERPREADREVERRYRPSAFSERAHGGQDDARATPGHAFAPARQMRAASSRYGGGAARTDDSPTQGDDPGSRDRQGGGSDEVRAPQVERRRAGGAWERATPERGRMPAEPARSGPGAMDSVGRRVPAPGAERTDDTQFDADYRQWREEQMRLLDLDYAQWRKERYRKFAEEFSQWRSQRLKASPAGRSAPDEASASLGDMSPLGPAGPVLRGEERERPHEAQRERSGGGLLGSLLGGHSERHKPQP